MLTAIDDLTRAVPHERPGRRYTLAEWRIYCEGYSWALVMSYQVLELAYSRWRSARATRRSTVKLSREKAGVA